MSNFAKVVVTGGAGYIGSHVVVELLKKGLEVCIIDNFVNSDFSRIDILKRITNRDIKIIKSDVQDIDNLYSVFDEFRPDAVIHLAGLKSISEANADPTKYYENNVVSTIRLIKVMEQFSCNKLVFSSSATVYGDAEYLPVDENHPIKPNNTYAMTKVLSEQIITDWVGSKSDVAALILRYFNPVGADAAGLLGEYSYSTATNIMPVILKSVMNPGYILPIYGNDYDTRDGTGERDFIHVEDLASAHLAGLHYILSKSGVEKVNVGTGRGTTVLELLSAVERVYGEQIKFSYQDRREGDIPVSFADVRKAKKLLNWSATKNIDDMCSTALKCKLLDD